MKKIAGNEIARTLDVADAQTRYDAAARKLVAQKAILAYILKSALDEFADVPVGQIASQFIEDPPQVSETAVHQDHPDALPMQEGKPQVSGRIRELPTEEVSVREGVVRYDVRAAIRLPEEGGRMMVIVNVEIQNRDTPGYPIPKRGIYYASRLVSAQRGTIFKDQEYGKIKKVASIWICVGTARVRSDTINEYRLVEKCRRGAFREGQKNYDLITVIIMRLGPHGEKSEDDAIRLLSKLFSTKRSAADKKVILEEEFGIKMTEEIEQEVSQVCNLSEGIYENGMVQGMAQGIAQGRSEGALEMLFNLVRDGLLTLAVAAQKANMEQAVFEQRYRNYCG